jgi:Flp pilus assembly protein TadD
MVQLLTQESTTEAASPAGDHDGLRDDWGPKEAWVSRLALVALVAYAFYPALANGFADSDDRFNFEGNMAYRGLGRQQIAWAWQTTLLGVYQPLGWMLLSAEYAVWRLDPRGYHLTSLVLYAANTVALLSLTTALVGRSSPELRAGSRREWGFAATVAVALFAVHPFRVEVVAWASCQPYLPCALLAILSVLAYLHAHEPGRPPRRSWLAASFALFGVSLLCKAASSSLPVVLVILDVHPLRRLGGGRWFGPAARRVWAEKVPFVALSVVFMAIAIRVREGRSEFTSPSSRIAHACASVGFYPYKTSLPLNLTAAYPMERPMCWSDPEVWAGLAVLVGVSAMVVCRRCPGLSAAWVAYLVMLAPVSGLVYSGPFAAADRYSYLSTMAFVPLVAAGLVRARRASRLDPMALGLAAIAAVTCLALLSRGQCRLWKDQETLYRHALEHGADRSTQAHIELASYLQINGRYREALEHYYRVMSFNPNDMVARSNAGSCLSAMGRFAEAEPLCADAARRRPQYPGLRYNYGKALAGQGKYALAVEQFRLFLRDTPESGAGRQALGDALARQGRLDEAVRHLNEALRLGPRMAETHFSLGFALDRLGRRGEAAAHYAEALRIRPTYAEARLDREGRPGADRHEPAGSDGVMPGRAGP